MKSEQFPQTTAIRPLLKRAGFSEKEIEVYLALLPIKSARVSTIAVAAKQSRSHTYLVLRSLMEKGLVSEVERGRVIHFVAEPPQRILTYLDHQERALQQLKPLVRGALPLLQSLETPLLGRPRVTMSYGIEGMKQLYRDVLEENFCAFFNPKMMYDAFGGNVQLQLFVGTAHFHGRDLVVSSQEAEKYTKEMRKFPEHQVRFLPRGIEFPTDTIAFKDTVAYFAYDDEKTIVRIQNQNIADGFLAVFNAMWKFCEGR